MPINPDAVGTVADPVEVSWSSKDCLLYAVGVGAGTHELAFTTENSTGIEQQVLPTFAVVVGIGGAAMTAIGTFNWAMLVHGEQSIKLHGPIPVDGRIKVTSKVAAIWDKGSAAVVVLEADAADAKTDEPMFSTSMSAFIRGEGGWGGDRGPSGPRNVAPEREPDHVVRYQVGVDQALVYRLSGDRNPLHSDPEFAKLAGFDRPILHGLCTYGYTGRALLSGLCGSDPARFQAMEGRFSKPVYPGDELTVKMWEIEAGQAVYRTETQRGEVVIDSGLCRFS